MKRGDFIHDEDSVSESANSIKLKSTLRSSNPSCIHYSDNLRIFSSKVFY